MGMVPGARITVQKFAPLGDPMEIKVKGFNLSLRKSEAAKIEVEVG
jgi:ferrous iron transport protein A